MLSDIYLIIDYIVCKPSVAHGSKMAHQMSIVFHEGAVGDCEPPCVAMTFIPHDAVLFKIFVIGQKYFVVERPSLKNFEAAGNLFKFFLILINFFNWIFYSF